MTKKEKLIKEVGEVYELDGNETVAELEKLKKEIDRNKENAEDTKTDEDPKDETKTETKKDGGKIYLWLKTRAYVSDSERINPGLYCLTKDKMFPRLEKAGAVVCEIFEGEIPSRSLVRIARKCGVNPDKYEEDEDLLDVLVTKGVKTF